MEKITLAYSYIRFSSSKQAGGDSLRRQTAAAARYALMHGLTLDESLTYRDLGVSAYDASNVRKGALGVFLTALRNGTVPVGSYFLVEQLDRMSRDDVFLAMDVLREIVDAGVLIVTLADERVLTKDNISKNENLMLTMSVMFRAHEESSRKSQLIGDAWTARRDRRPAVITRECPRWLVARADKSGYDVIPERVESIQKVFNMMAGGFGNIAIVRKANLERWPAPATGNHETGIKTWHSSLVVRLINNRSVLGEYQPFSRKPGKQRAPDGLPWLNYYPQIIDEQLYNLAHAAKSTRAALPRRRDAQYLNVFQGIICCACGSSFSRKNKASVAQPGYVQYICTDRIRAVTACPSISALKLHPPLLRGIFEAGFVSVSQNEFISWARDEVDAAKEAYVDTTNRLENILLMLETAKDSEALLSRMQLLEASVREKSAQLDERISWLASLTEIVDVPGRELDIADSLTRLSGDENIEFRAALHERLTRVIQKIIVSVPQMSATIVWRAPRADTVINLG